MAFVLLPCDLPSWTQVARALTSLTSCTTPAQVTRGIYDVYCLCNVSIEPELSEGDLGEEKFAGLEELLTKEGGVWRDGEKTEERRGERRRVNEGGGGGGGGGGGDFFTHILPTMVNYALKLKDLKPKEGLMYSLQQEGGDVVVSRDLAASLLAHMFFCTLPPRHSLSHPTLTPPSLAHTLSTLYRESQRVKVRSLLHYFRLLGRMEPSSTSDMEVRFSRKVMGSREFVMLREWCGSVVGLCGVMTQQEGHSRIQHTPPPALLTCFTAAHLALPSLLHHTSQQVSVMYGQPESLIAAILVESLEDNEALQIQGAVRVGTLLGLDSRPVFIPRKTPEIRGLIISLIDPDDYHQSDILQYEDVNLLRELNKAYLGFTQPTLPKTSRSSSGVGVILANRSGQSRRGSNHQQQQQQQQQQKGVFGQKGVDSNDSDIISVSRQDSPSRLDAQVSSSSSNDKEARREGREERSAEENDSELKTQRAKTDGGKDAGSRKEQGGKPTRADEGRDGNGTGTGGKADREVRDKEGQADRDVGKTDKGITGNVKKIEAKDEASKDDRDDMDRDTPLKKEGEEIIRGRPRSIKRIRGKDKNDRDEPSKDDRDEADRDALLNKGGEIVRGRPGSVKKIGGIMTKIKEKIRSRGSERSSVRGAKSRGTSSERSWKWKGWRDGEKKAAKEGDEWEKRGEKGSEEERDGGKTEKKGEKNEGGSEDGRERDRKKSDEEKKELEPERQSRGRQKESMKETKMSSKDQPQENIKSETKSHHKPERTRRKPNKQELADRLEKVVAKQEELAEKLKQVEEQQNSMEKLGRETGNSEWDASQDEREELKLTGTTAEDDEGYSETKDDRKEGKEDEDSRRTKAEDKADIQEKQADSKDEPRRRRQSRRLSSKQDSADGSFVTAPSTLRRPPKKGKQKPGDKTEAKKEIIESDADRNEATGVNKERYGSPDIKETPSNTRTGASLEEQDPKEGEEEEDETARLLNRVLRAIQRLEKERPDLVEEASREEQEQALKQDEPKKPKTILRVKGKPPPIPAPRSRAGKSKEEEAADRKGRRRLPEESESQGDTIKENPEEGRRPPREGILRKRGTLEEEALMNARRGLLEKKLEEEVRPLTLRGRGRGRRLVIKEEKEAEDEEPANVRRARIIRELVMKRDEQRSAWTSNDPNKVDELTPLQLKRQRLLKIKQGMKSMYYSCADDMPGRPDLPARHDMPSQPDLPFSDPRLAVQKSRLRGPKHRSLGRSQEDDLYFSACESFDLGEGSTPQRRGSRRRSGRSRRKTSFAERLKEALARESSRDSQLLPGTETDRRLNRQESGGFVLDSHGFDNKDNDEEEDDVFTSGEEDDDDLEGTDSSHYSFSSDYTSELEAVYEDLGSALQDLEEGNLGPRTAAIARFAHGLFKRALSESYKDVPLGLDGGAVAGGRSDGTGVGQQMMPPRSLSLSERRQPPSSAPPPSPIRSTRIELGLPVVTGNWGCGALRGDHQLKAMIQWAAASLAGAPKMIYYTYGHPSVVKLDIVCRLLVDRGWSIGDLVTTLLHHARQHLYHWKENEHTESADSSLPEAQRYKNPSLEQLSLFDELIASDRPRLSCSKELETEL